MRSAKTQQRLKQEQLDNPYAINSAVYGEVSTFRVGGFVSLIGVLQLVVVLTLSGVVFGSALLFCVVLLVLLGIVLLHQSDSKSSKHGTGLKHLVNQLVALRRSALDYSLTLSIAQSEKKILQTESKEAFASLVTLSSKPQKVMTTMALKEMEAMETKLIKMDKFSHATLGRMNMPPLSTILMKSLMESTEDLFWKKRRANSEPNQVLRSRPLLPLELKVQPIVPAQEKKQAAQQELALAVSKALAKQASMTVEVSAKKPQPELRKATPEASDVAIKEPMELPVPMEPKVVISGVLPQKNIVAGHLKRKQVEDVSSPTSAVESVVPFLPLQSVFPKHKPLIEVAFGEPPIEQDLVITRKVLLYLKPNVSSVMSLEEQNLEHEIRDEQEVALQYEKLLLKEFPPLSPPAVPQPAISLPATDNMEPNFLMDIKLEPISKPEKKLALLNSLRLEPVGNDDLRLMLDEVDAMHLELDAAIARCTALLNEEAEKISVHPSLLDKSLTC